MSRRVRVFTIDIINHFKIKEKEQTLMKKALLSSRFYCLAAFSERISVTTLDAPQLYILHMHNGSGGSAGQVVVVNIFRNKR